MSESLHNRDCTCGLCVPFADDQRKLDEEAAERHWPNKKDLGATVSREIFILGIRHCRETEVKSITAQRDALASSNKLYLEQWKSLKEQLRVAVEALEQVVKHEQDSLKYDSEIHKFNRYRENMYFKCLEALQKIEALKGGGDE